MGKEQRETKRARRGRLEVNPAGPVGIRGTVKTKRREAVCKARLFTEIPEAETVKLLFCFISGICSKIKPKSNFMLKKWKIAYFKVRGRQNY